MARVKETEEQRDKTDQEMSRIQHERDELERRRGMNRNNIQNTSAATIYNNSQPPKFPSLASKVSHWENRMSLFLQTQGLSYTIRHSTNPVPIINNDDRESLVYRYGEQTVADHEKAWGFLLDATTYAPFEERLQACKTLEEARWTIVGWHLPTTDSEEEFLTHQLKNAKMAADEDPQLFFARID